MIITHDLFTEMFWTLFQVIIFFTCLEYVCSYLKLYGYIVKLILVHSTFSMIVLRLNADYCIIISCQLGRLFQMLEGLGTQIEKDGLLDKYRKPELNSVFVEEWCSLTKQFLKALPYSLTRSQLSAVSEIIWDLKRQIPMNRLLQVLIFLTRFCFGFYISTH